MGPFPRSRPDAARRWYSFVLLVVAILSAPTPASAAGLGSHCARHGASAMHMAAAGHADMGGGPHHLSWQPAAPGDCPHCPASDCARLLPCASTTAVAALLRSDDLTLPAVHGDRIRRASAAVHSTIPAPPTPPPQLIA